MHYRPLRVRAPVHIPSPNLSVVERMEEWKGGGLEVKIKAKAKAKAKATSIKASEDVTRLHQP